ncbi:MAG: C1 family peptidase [Minicystis sp.]
MSESQLGPLDGFAVVDPAVRPADTGGVDPPARLTLDYVAGCVDVHDQGQCGWCALHATTAMIEAELCRVGRPGQLSQPHLAWAGGWRPAQEDSAPECAGGWFITDALRAMDATRIVNWTIWPFTASEKPPSVSYNAPRRRPSDAVLQHDGMYSVHPADIFAVSPKNVGALKAALASGHTVAYDLGVFDRAGWDRGEPERGHIHTPDPLPAAPRAYHAVLIVGYSDNAPELDGTPDFSHGGGSFRFLNSWGSGFGYELDGASPSGYGWIDYDVIEAAGRGGVFMAGVDVHDPGPASATNLDDDCRNLCIASALCGVPGDYDQCVTGCTGEFGAPDNSCGPFNAAEVSCYWQYQAANGCAGTLTGQDLACVNQIAAADECASQF